MDQDHRMKPLRRESNANLNPQATDFMPFTPNQENTSSASMLQPTVHSPHTALTSTPDHPHQDLSTQKQTTTFHRRTNTQNATEQHTLTFIDGRPVLRTTHHPRLSTPNRLHRTPPGWPPGHAPLADVNYNGLHPSRISDSAFLKERNNPWLVIQDPFAGGNFDASRTPVSSSHYLPKIIISRFCSDNTRSGGLTGSLP